jgi:hypothetical protein
VDKPEVKTVTTIKPKVETKKTDTNEASGQT